ncbi:MAG: hypothetical protein A4S12_04105 [Proteobacteria bacterium SG_bin5]|nr:type II toxin-antitoxin system RelE/ParE family toxin [Sphingomonas sp.]OQW43708.1 MAG: hypothetical protein A4S12_04105 [Proteobacteria bacterium SG_bin5]
MRQLVWSRAARNDLFDIAAYYRGLDRDLEFLMLERVETAPLVLLDFPDLGSPTRHPTIRKWRVADTPFLLFYRPARHQIEVRRVVHHARDWSIEP